jgi:predicted RNA-binding protein Jag
MQNPFLKKMIIALASGFLAFASISGAAPASATTVLDATGVTFEFNNDDDIDGEIGEYTLYQDVATIEGIDIDAKVTAVAQTDEDVLEEIDEYDSDEDYFGGLDTNIWVGCGIDCWPYDTEFWTPADGFKGSLTINIEFFEAGTENPVTLENFSFYVKDIDTYQYIEVLDPDAYVFDAETNLSAVYPENDPEIADGNVRFYEANGVESSSSDQPHWVQINFDSISSLTYKVGQNVPGGAFFGVYFTSAEFDNPVVTEAVFTPPVPVKIFKKVFFDGDSAYLKPIWFKRLDKLIASVPTCATDVTAKIFSGVKKAKSEVKGSDLAQRRAAIVKKFLTKRGLNTTVTLKPNGKGVKAKNNQRFAKIVVSYNGANCN